MTQGIFVGHHDRTGAVFVHYQERSDGREKLDETDTERCNRTRLSGTACVARRGKCWLLNLRRQKNVTFDKEGAGRPLEPRRFHVLSRLTGHSGGCPGCAALASHEKATKPHVENESERFLREL